MLLKLHEIVTDQIANIHELNSETGSKMKFDSAMINPWNAPCIYSFATCMNWDSRIMHGHKPLKWIKMNTKDQNIVDRHKWKTFAVFSKKRKQIYAQDNKHQFCFLSCTCTHRIYTKYHLYWAVHQ